MPLIFPIESLVRGAAENVILLNIKGKPDVEFY